MNEYPILFSTEMVKAILDGRKTQTRRVIKPQLSSKILGGVTIQGYGNEFHFPTYDTEYPVEVRKCPYGAHGDLLYVREKWGVDRIKVGDGYEYPNVLYRADSTTKLIICDEVWDYYEKDNFKWRPSIHMPKAFARIWLRVKDVRVERVQDISQDDAIAEGIDMESEHASLCINIEDAGYDNDLVRGSAAFTIFKTLWNSINEKRGYGWDTNPWVWVVEFERVEHDFDGREVDAEDEALG